MKDFSQVMEYQIARQAIRDYPDIREYGKYIKFLPKHLKTGLFREFRAYKYLVAKYKNDRVAISNFEEDKKGIDLVIERDLEEGAQVIYFAVSGPADKELHLNCNFKLIVTDKTIYQEKVWIQ